MCIDSQSVKTTEIGGDDRGYDGGKKIKGRKRHLLVDTLGLLVAVMITGAGGDVIGCDAADPRHINRIENAGADFAPGSQYESKRVPMLRKDGTSDWVIVFRVFYHATRVIETVKRKVFVRLGDRKKELKSDEERRQLRIDKGEIQFEQEPSGLQYPQEFDMPLIQRFCNSVRSVRGLQESTTDLKVLASLRLGKKDGERFLPNIACAILFAHDSIPVIPGCKIHFLRYEGKVERHGADFNETANLEPIEGPLPKQIVEIGEVLNARIKRYQGFGDDGKFHTRPEYPPDALTEAIVNACVHRSYNFRTRKIFVRMFDDRIEIESPGGFPPGVTPKTIYEIQHSRNPFIMEAMRYLGYVREIGEGATRIRDEMLKLELPEPEFSQVDESIASVVVRLRTKSPVWTKLSDSDVAKIVGENVTSRLSASEKMILNYVAVEGRINASKVMHLTTHNWHTSKKILDALVTKGILEYHRRHGTEVERKAYFTLRNAGGDAKSATRK